MSLTLLPGPALEAVVAELPFNDACSLRLTAQELADNVAHTTTFRSYCSSKSLTLSREDLETFAQATKQAWLCSALRHLTIIGSVPGEDDLVPSTDGTRLLEILKRALSRIQEHSSHHLSRSLTLDLKQVINRFPMSTDCGRDWPAVWKCADDTALLVAQAVGASSIRFEHVSLYSRTDRCALRLPVLEQIMQHFNRHAIKTLALTITTSDEVSDPSLAQYMVDMLSSADRLEHLELRWFNRRALGASAAELVDRSFFESIASLSMPRLIRLSLRGIRTSEVAMLTFLKANSRLVDVTLEEIHLTEGRFVAILAYLNENLAALESLYLNDLWETSLIRFPDSKGKPHFPSLRDKAPTWMKRSKDDRQWGRTIRYRESQSRQASSPASIAWLRKKTLQYGPVEFGSVSDTSSQSDS